MLQSATAPLPPALAGLAASVSSSLAPGVAPARTFTFQGLADSASQDDKPWLAWKVAGWIIATVLSLAFALIVALVIFDPSYLDLQPGHTYAWHWRRYRVPVAIAMMLLEAALIGAIAIRDRRRQRCEFLLRESEERMTLAADAADLGLWRWDAGADRYWMTSHCREMFAVPAGAEYSMAAMTAAIFPEDRKQVLRTIRRASVTGAIFDIRCRFRAEGGQTRWVRSRGRPTRDAGGRITGMAGTAVDISESMKMQAEIDRQQQSLVHLTRVGTIGELSGALAHELNQPLTAILSNAQAVLRMIGRDPINVAELRDAIVDIIDDDSRAGDVIRHMRALLKKDDTRRAPVDMDGLVRKVLFLARNELNAKHVAPVVKLADDLPLVLGQSVQLQQLLLNLILNAAEAMSSRDRVNGVLFIAGAVLENRMFHLSVSDTGPGITPEIAEKIFEPFFSTKKQGLGLGLSICRSIVEGHGGSIRAENNSWDGATFHIFLPLAEGAV